MIHLIKVTIQLSGARTNKTSWFKFYCRDFLRDVLEMGEDEASPTAHL
jgi:hypothetical protein